ncbi:MAG: carbon-phosphorus lyase complex subunit PhnI [Actinobacteria bacterium]|nr:carbon-phosphorus lyase complex subunit PhnI [Actinomycetota bacterium]
MSNRDYLENTYRMLTKSLAQSGLKPSQSLNSILGVMALTGVVEQYMAETSLPDEEKAALADLCSFIRTGDKAVLEKHGNAVKLEVNVFTILKNAADCGTNPCNPLLQSYIQEKTYKDHTAAKEALLAACSIVEEEEGCVKEHQDFTRLWCLLARVLDVTPN